MNHGKTNVLVKFCPTCGEKFKSSSVRNCDDTRHKERRKQGDVFCCDCGLNLKK